MKDLLDESMREPVSMTFQAYNAMETTKRRHFDYLNLLESRRKKFNLEASADEVALLGELLEDHDRAVKKFQQTSKELQQAHPQAHESLFRYIGLLNEALGDVGRVSGH